MCRRMLWRVSDHVEVAAGWQPVAGVGASNPSATAPSPRHTESCTFKWQGRGVSSCTERRPRDGVASCGVERQLGMVPLGEFGLHRVVGGRLRISEHLLLQALRRTAGLRCKCRTARLVRGYNALILI